MLSYVAKCCILLSVCDECLNDFVRVPVNVEEAVY